MGRKKKKTGGNHSGKLAERKRKLKSDRKKLKKGDVKAPVASEGKKSSSSLYSVEDYLAKVEEMLDSFQLDLAIQFCERALELEPSNVAVLDTMAPLLLEVGDTERAFEMFQECVKLSPSSGAAKYLYLGQLTVGVEAVSHISKGIEILKGVVEEEEKNQGATEEAAESGQSKEQLSSAYCALAEVYLTDACFEEDAGERCYENCCQAVLVSPSNAEAHQLKASCLLSQQKPQEAKETLMEGLSLWLPSLLSKRLEDEEEGTAEMELGRDIVELPSYSSRVGVAKLLLELEENDMAFEVLEGLLGEDDEVVGVWYLMGWLHHLLGDADSARFYLEQMQTLYVKLGCDEEDILQHAQDILKEIGHPGIEEDDGEEGNDVSKEEESDEEKEGKNEKHEEMEDCMDVT